MESKFSDREDKKPEDKQNLTTNDSLQQDKSDGKTDDQTLQAEKLAKIEKGLKIIILISIVIAVLITIALIMTIFLLPVEDTTRYGVTSEESICSNLGLNILKAGGSAVDAAVTTVLCVGSINPKASGIGGCGVMIVRNHATNETNVYDFLCTAPADTSGTYNDQSVAGRKVAVPGLLRGMQDAHNVYGKLAWKDVVMAVVNVTEQQATAKRAKAAEVSVNFTALAQVLRQVAEQGADAFYTGDIAKEIADEIKQNDGTMTVDDLKQYKAVVTPAIAGLFLNRLVETTPAPSSGPLLLMLLNTMHAVYQNDSSLFNSTLYYHYFVEAMKFSFAAQSQLGDPYLAAITNVTNRLISPSFGSLIASQINPEKTELDATYYTDIVGQPATGGTSHVSVIDNADIIVSVSVSLHNDYGSGLVTPSGIVLNDYMTAFSDSGNNKVAPGKRPVTTLVPAVVSTQNILCENRYAVGAAHGDNSKISGVADIVLNNAARQMSLQTAVAEPTVYGQLDPDQITYETGLSNDVIDLLKDKGHTDLKEDSNGISWVDVLAQDKLNITGYVDPHSKSAAAATVYPQQR